MSNIKSDNIFDEIRRSFDRAEKEAENLKLGINALCQKISKLKEAENDILTKKFEKVSISSENDRRR